MSKLLRSLMQQAKDDDCLIKPASTDTSSTHWDINISIDGRWTETKKSKIVTVR
ncbi:hypothetical protein RUM44_013845 [Polyplax serrata]|uniref:Uncharacterized protein n=1 Tax=Polyplax serrata TaxID=468196 RepID=A0ABR1BIY2_POLSC